MEKLELSILCRFWEEDGLWNGIAVNLPIAVFGDTFEESLSNMRDAVESHVEAVVEAGPSDELQRLQEHRQSLDVDEIPFDSPLVKLLVAMDKLHAA